MAQFKMSCGTYDPLSLNSRLNTVGDQLFGDSVKRNGDHFGGWTVFNIDKGFSKGIEIGICPALHRPL